jgi:hypothetical protein
MSQATRSTLPGSAAPQIPPPNPGAQAVVVPGREIPRQLARIRLATALLAVLFAMLTAGQLVLSYQALEAAAKDTERLVRVSDIKVNLLRADASATNAFLVGGLEPPEQRAVYDESIAAATRGITEAAGAQPLDGAVLAELNQVLVDYSAGMAQARATNRQGLPVGAGYLSSSSAELRGRGVALIDAAIEANTNRSEASLARQFPLLVALPGVAALITLILLNQWIARRFRRRVNTGIAGAFAAILLLTVAATAVSAAQANENASLRDGSYATAVTAAEVRSAANAAKANESLRLISRGSGQAYETAWANNAEVVTAAFARPEFRDIPRDEWDEYVTGHAEIVARDDRGDWEGAVALATSRAPDSPSMVFARFDGTLHDTVTTTADRTAQVLTSGRVLFAVLAVLTVLGGLVAAGLGWRGVTARLEEYT